MNQKIKRFLSLFLSLVMAMAALPAYAAPEPATDQSSTSVERSADSSRSQRKTTTPSQWRTVKSRTPSVQTQLMLRLLT